MALRAGIPPWSLAESSAKAHEQAINKATVEAKGKNDYKIGRDLFPMNNLSATGGELALGFASVDLSWS